MNLQDEWRGQRTWQGRMNIVLSGTLYLTLLMVVALIYAAGSSASFRGALSPQAWAGVVFAIAMTLLIVATCGGRCASVEERAREHAPPPAPPVDATEEVAS